MHLLQYAPLLLMPAKAARRCLQPPAARAACCGHPYCCAPTPAPPQLRQLAPRPRPHLHAAPPRHLMQWRAPLHVLQQGLHQANDQGHLGQGGARTQRAAAEVRGHTAGAA